MIKHILFPFDFSPQGVQAVPFVRAIANRFSAKVTLFSVIPPVWDVSGAMGGIAGGDDLDDVMRELKARLDRTLVDDFAGVDVERIVDSGDPAFTITDFAHVSGVDLIMMPTHGHGRFRGLLLGSVTAKVLHDAKYPVWTAAHAETQRAPGLPRTILCALDGTATNSTLLQWAAKFSTLMGATLELLHVVPPISDWLSLESERSLQDKVREHAHAKIAAIQKSSGVDAPLRLAVGEIVGAVTEEARQEDADLILIGRGSIHSTLGRLRTHAYGIIKGSPCPVLSV